MSEVATSEPQQLSFLLHLSASLKCGPTIGQNGTGP